MVRHCQFQWLFTIEYLFSGQWVGNEMSVMPFEILPKSFKWIGLWLYFNVTFIWCSITKNRSNIINTFGSSMFCLYIYRQQPELTSTGFYCHCHFPKDEKKTICARASECECVQNKIDVHNEICQFQLKRKSNLLEIAVATAMTLAPEPTVVE